MLNREDDTLNQQIQILLYKEISHIRKLALITPTKCVYNKSETLPMYKIFCLHGRLARRFRQNSKKVLFLEIREETYYQFFSFLNVFVISHSINL